MSLYYNVESLVPAGGRLATAIINGNRADAWYEIRYGSNRDHQHASRRYEEANLFSLYDNAIAPNLDDSKQAYRMFTLHREDILKYETQYPPTNAAIGTIAKQLDPAKLMIMADLGGNSNTDVVAAYQKWVAMQGHDPATFNSTDIYLDPGRVLSTQTASLDFHSVISAWLDSLTGVQNTRDSIVIGESNTGSGDYLIGSNGSDLLVGGNGNDYLDGGTGKDVLAGGAGNDTYIINAGETATIEDKQGINRIILNGKALGDFYTTDGGATYISYDGDFTATLVNGDLLVNDTSGARLTLNQNFQSGDFGITLTNAPVAPIYATTIYGDIVPTDIDPATAGIQAVADANGNPDGTAGAYADILVGTADNDHIISGTLDDNVGGGAGDDWIEAGTGNDYVLGQDGNDIIEGGAGSDILTGDAGNDLLYANTKITTAQAIANGNTDIATNLKGDWLAGGSGSDTLIAGADNDVLAGGGGNDLIIAGAGDDYILGDAEYTPAFITETTPRYSMSGTLWYHTSTTPFDWTATPDATGTYVFNPVTGVNNPADSGADVIYAGDGNDHVWAGAGDDVIYGEGGNDVINGEAGNDIIMGGAGDDTLSGDASYIAASLHGDDYIDGGDGNDTLNGDGGNDILLGGAGADMLYGGTGANYLDGGTGNDTLNTAGAGGTLLGGAGDDNVNATGGGNYLDGGDGNDNLWVSGSSNQLFGGTGDDSISATGGGNYLDGEAGNNTLTASGGNNELFAGAGNDTLSAAGGNSYLDAGDGANSLVADGGGNQLFAGSGNDTLSASGDNNYLDGGAGTNTLSVIGINNQLIAGAGNDRLTASGGYNTLDGGEGDNTLGALGGHNRLYAGSGIDNLQAGGGNNYLDAGAGNDSLIADMGNNTLLGGAGDDYLSSTGGGSTLDGGTGADTLVADMGFNTLYGGDGNDTLAGYGGNNILYGGAGDDTLFAYGGGNTLDGGDGMDLYVFDAGFGTNHISDSGRSATGQVGGNTVAFNFNFAGSGIVIGLGSLKLSFATGDVLHIDNFDPNDPLNTCSITTFRFNDTTLSLLDILTMGGTALNGTNAGPDILGTNNADVIQGTAMGEHIYGFQGDDTINGGDGYDVIDGGDGNDTIDGGTGGDVIYGGNGDDIINGGTGADVMKGGYGNDTYYVDNTGDQVIEDSVGIISGFWWAGQYYSSIIQDYDTVNASISYTLGKFIENLNLTGIADLNGTGNELGNVIRGNDGNNILDGGAGNDWLEGGTGADTLYGGADNDMLDGGAGADIMVGGVGDDTYVVDNMGDVWIENANEGIDTVNISFTYTLDANFENLTLTGINNIDGTGNELDNIITGNYGNNVLSGGMGNDTIYGDFGDDSLSGGMGDDKLYGGYGRNTLSGEAGNDYLEDFGNGSILDGGVGADTLVAQGTNSTLLGGTGDDTYVIFNSQTVITENTNEGVDTVIVGYSGYTLGSNLENLVLVTNYYAPGIATGNELDNVITVGNSWANAGPANTLLGGGGNDTIYGGAGNDLLLGGTGADMMYGGNGADTYFVDNAGDQVIEVPNTEIYYTWNGYWRVSLSGAPEWVAPGWKGADTVNASVSFILGDYVEDLNLTGTDNLSGTGNVLDNVICGNTGHNVLIGFGGDDTINGGDDVPVSSGIPFPLGVPFPPGMPIPGPVVYAGRDDTLIGGDGNDVLNGNGGNDYLEGDAGNDTLNGGLGVDDMLGGVGNDTYMVDGNYVKTVATSGLNDCGDPVLTQHLVWTTDNVTELAGEGYDIVYSSASYRLTDNVEDLQLVTDPLATMMNPQLYADLIAYGQDGTGNALDNTIIGNAFNNRLDGGAGADTLSGGAGNDTYVIDQAGDRIIELAGGGIDTVESHISYALSDVNLENLTLLDGATDGQGNAADNVLIGNAANNVLQGMDGNDKLIGGAGNDILLGGAGDDRYVFRLGDGTDVINDTQGNNTLFIGSDKTSANLEVKQVGNDVLVSIVGTTDSILLSNWFSQAQGVKRIEFCNGSALDSAGIMALMNQPPVANPDAIVAYEDGGVVNVPVLANDFDPNPNDSISVVSVGTSTAGAAVTLTNGQVQYNIGNGFQYLAQGQTITDSFNYTISDNHGATASSVVTVTITGTNDAPVTTVDTAAVQEDVIVTASGNVLANDTDVDQGTVLSVANAGTYKGTYGSLVLNADGSYSYALDNASLGVQSLAQGQVVTETFAYQATDGIVATPSTLTVSITGTNDAPVVAVPLADQVAKQGRAINFTVPANTFYDVDHGDVLTYSATLADGSALPAWIGFDAATRTFSGLMGDIGTWEFRVTATDTAGASASDVFALNVEYAATPGQSLEGTGYNDTLIGTSGDDWIDGKGGADIMKGGMGNDTYLVDNAGDMVVENAWSGMDTVLSSVSYALGADVEYLNLMGSSSINGTGNELNNLLVGNEASNLLYGMGGNDIMQGGGGVDVLTDTIGNNLFDGGAGSDTLTGGTGNDFYTGNKGNDTISTGNGADVIAFNHGDGQDVLYGGIGTDNTLSLGGGIYYSNLALSKVGNDLVVEFGDIDQLTLKNWYDTTANYKSVLTLQVVADSMSDFNPASTDPLLNKAIQDFDFTALVNSFDQSGAPSHWSMMNTLLSAHLSGSDTAALGGDLAHQYGMADTFAGMNLAAAQTVINDAKFGTQAQMLHSLPGLQGGGVATLQ